MTYTRRDLVRYSMQQLERIAELVGHDYKADKAWSMARDYQTKLIDGILARQRETATTRA